MIDDHSTKNRPMRAVALRWVSSYFDRPVNWYQVSCMVNVRNAGCQSVKGTAIFVNVKYLVTIVGVIRTLTAGVITPSNILVILYYAEDVRLLKSMLRISRIANVRVQDIANLVVTLDSTQCIQKEVTIISPCKDGIKPVGCTDNVRRFPAALTRARSLRIIVARTEFGFAYTRSHNQECPRVLTEGSRCWRRAIDGMVRNDMVRNVNINDAEVAVFDRAIDYTRYE